MVEIKLHELMGKNRIRSIRQLSEDTKISRVSLTKLYNGDAKGIEFGTVDILCAFFDCSISDLLEYVAEKG